MLKKEVIRYDVDRDAWLVNRKVRPYALHCGECFEIAVGSVWLRCRLEIDSNWYVFMDGTKFTLHPRMEYTIRM